MRYFPMFLKLDGRRAVVVGGGETAARKVRLLLKTEAEIVVAAPVLDVELADAAKRGRVVHEPGAVDAALFADTALVFVATGCPGADAATQAIAKSSGAIVNVVDAPELCDAVTPAIVDRDPVVVAIGTEGTAPVLARQIKSMVETMLEPRLGDLAALAGRLRGAARRLPPDGRRAFWRWAFSGAPRQSHRAGREREAATLIKERLAANTTQASDACGFVSLVGAGPGTADLITLRGVQRLQEADAIFYDRLVEPKLLELARRDAERVYVGKTVGAVAWPQSRINALIVAEARKGKQVVRLKSGDPGMFGRTCEETEALNAAGVPWEIVPGVTAASAAAAATNESLTERGSIDTVVFTTGRARAGDPTPSWSDHLRPGVAMAFYMGVGAAARIESSCLDQGADSNLPVDIVESVGGAGERRVRTTLGALKTTIDREAISNPAVIIIRNPKNGSARKADAAPAFKHAV